MNDIWECRYRELERQLQYMVMHTAAVMQTNEEEGLGARLVTVRIRKVLVNHLPEGVEVICVADGENLDYTFTVIGDDGESDLKRDVRNNSVVILRTLAGGEHVRVTVRSHRDGQTISATRELGR